MVGTKKFMRDNNHTRYSHMNCVLGLDHKHVCAPVYKRSAAVCAWQQDVRTENSKKEKRNGWLWKQAQ